MPQKPQILSSLVLALAVFGGIFGLFYLAVGAMFTLGTPTLEWGFIIDAQILECHPTTAYRNEALGRMRELVREDPQWPTRSDWAEDFARKVESDTGVVLTMAVLRRRDIREERHSSQSGTLKASNWKAAVSGTQRYYARYAGSECAAYRVGARRFFAPVWEASQVSPPDGVPSFMGLFVLEDVPPDLARFTQPGA
jgi:hypothetical protein